MWCETYSTYGVKPVYFRDVITWRVLFTFSCWGILDKSLVTDRAIAAKTADPLNDDDDHDAPGEADMLA